MKTECWEWKGSTDRQGYGQIRLGDSLYYVHRVMAMLHLGLHGRSKLQVLHTCDNPLCYNPAHLALGTQRDNMRDMLKKGRQKRNSERTYKMAQQVYELRQQGLVFDRIAEKLGIHDSYARNLFYRYYGTRSLRPVRQGLASLRPDIKTKTKET